MNDQEFLAAAKAAMYDQSPVTWNLTIADCWMMISAIQLAFRHPQLQAPLKANLVRMCDAVIDTIAQKHPEAREALNMGWNPQHDKPPLKVETLGKKRKRST